MAETRRWFHNTKTFSARARPMDAAVAPDLWTRCTSCGTPLFNETLVDNSSVCPACGHHFPVGGAARIEMLCDPGTVTWHDADLISVDALSFVDSKPYERRIVASRKQVGTNDAFVSGSGRIDGLPVEVGSFEFRFMGGSMGSVVGEMITRVFERATARKVPAVVVSASGGARMQEGVLSLMQMAKTCAAVARLKDDAHMPYISVLTHPTTGGVAASFSMLGDIILAEPGALIGFAGPRVIKETIGQDLPEGFQTSEYLLEHGMIDRVVKRTELRGVIAQLLAQLTHAGPRSTGA